MKIEGLTIEKEIELITEKISQRQFEEGRLIFVKNEFGKGVVNSKSKALLNGMVGMCYYRLCKYQLAIFYYEKSLKFFTNNLNDFYAEACQVYNSLGVLCRRKEMYSDGLRHLNKSIDISNEFGLVNSVAYNNLSTIFTRVKEAETALKYTNLAIHEEFKLPKVNIEKIFRYYYNKIASLIELKNYSLAINLLNQLSRFSKFKEGELAKQLNLKLQAQIAILQSDYKRAKRLCELAIKEGDRSHTMLDVLILYAKALKFLGQTDKAHTILKKALRLSEKKYRLREMAVLEELQLFYVDQKQFEDATLSLKKIIKLNEERDLIDKKNKFLELETAFETKRQDRFIEREQDYNNSLRNTNKSLEVAIEEHKKLELHLKSLQLQLSPHFIFNTLQSIQGFIFEKDAIVTSDYLTKFASLMRSVLNVSNENIISLKSEIDLLSNYILLEQTRFGGKFTFEIHTSNVANQDSCFLPALLVQPFVENAILHGLSRKVKGRIGIFFRCYELKTYIHVIDNGIGRQAASERNSSKNGCSTALKIMQERATVSKESRYFTYRYKIIDRVKDEQAKGTHVVIEVIDHGIN